MQVYFDNAATTPVESQVIADMTKALKDTYGNPSSIHGKGRSARALIEKARRTVANGLQASIGEIFFTSSATEANNTILRQAVDFLGVTRIISAPTEHPCVLKTIQDLAETKSIEAVWLQVDRNGNLDIRELEAYLKNQDKKTLVSLMYGNNEIGTINPIADISRLCTEYQCYLHCDAVQVLGKFPVDVQDIRFDFLSGTAHKFYGPKGAAFMYINQDSMIPPLLTGGAQERNMRAGTENLYGIVGLASAFDLSLKHMDERRQHIELLRTSMKTKLQEQFPTIQFNGDQEGKHLYHVLSVAFPHSTKNEMLIYNLDIRNIAASAGSACSSGTNTGSHVLAAIKPDDLEITIRFSFSHHNTMEEVDYVIDVLKELVEV